MDGAPGVQSSVKTSTQVRLTTCCVCALPGLKIETRGTRLCSSRLVESVVSHPCREKDRVMDGAPGLDGEPGICGRHRKSNRRSLGCARDDKSDIGGSEARRWDYSAARASAWLGKRPAYLVIPTMVKTLVKCGERPNA
jgi:hypothetical protein